MQVLDNIVASLDLSAGVRDIRQGIFHTGVLTRYCGLASSLPKDALKQGHFLVKEPGFLTAKTAEDLVKLAYSDSLLEAAIGMAAINSLLEVNVEDCIDLNAGDLLIEKGKNKNVAIIGHFPFIPDLRKAASRLWVIEKNPHGGDATEEEAADLLPQADVVGITGTSLTNHTFDDIIGLCRPDAYKVMLGDTAPLSPVLFDYGINAIAGTRVVDEELAMRCVSQGANFRQIKGILRLLLLKERHG
jgi:uncharacterized protein (DUF4213/DUF364 family)